MSTQFCPECRQPLKDVVHGIRFPDFKAALFRYIETHPGQSGQEIALHFDKNKINIRAHIYQINELMLHTGIRIEGHRFSGYYVKRNDECQTPVS